MSKKQTKCTPELTKKAVKYVKEGFTYVQLAAVLGISEDTLYLWFRKAKQEQKEPYLSFYVELKAAEAELLSECLQAVKASMKSGDARSAYFLLERRFSDSYGKRNALEVNSKSESLNLNVNANIDKNDQRMLIVGMMEKLSPKNNLLISQE